MARKVQRWTRKKLHRLRLQREAEAKALQKEAKREEFMYRKGNKVNRMFEGCGVNE